MRSETKIKVRNEDWPMECLSQRLKIGTRPCYIERYCYPIYPRVVVIRGKFLFSRSRGVNVFLGLGYGLPAALPHASPRLKILMAPHWFEECPPGQGTRWSVSRENSCSRDPGVKIGSWCRPKRILRSETKIAPPPGCLSQRLKFGTRPCYGNRYCFPINPIQGKLLFSRSRGSGGKCVRKRG